MSFWKEEGIREYEPCAYCLCSHGSWGRRNKSTQCILKYPQDMLDVKQNKVLRLKILSTSLHSLSVKLWCYHQQAIKPLSQSAHLFNWNDFITPATSWKGKPAKNWWFYQCFISFLAIEGDYTTFHFLITLSYDLQFVAFSQWCTSQLRKSWIPCFLTFMSFFLKVAQDVSFVGVRIPGLE